jgi:alkylhydroperoxidase family enzyme
MKKTLVRFALVVLCSHATAWAQETASDQPKPIPTTRAETKQLLQRLQARQPRLPVPDEVAVPNADPNRPVSNVINGRARRFYLPDTWLKAERFGNEANALVPYELKTQCFWIVSRGNNCHYCLGHQEHKLKLAGLDDNQIAALDRDWQLLDPKTRKAVELARKMTLLPFAITEQDLASAKKEFSDAEIIELVYAISRFNSMNRWTDSVGLPQDHEMRGEEVSFLTPTEERWNQGPSLAAFDSSIVRPEPWSYDSALQQIRDATGRTPRVTLSSISETRKKLELDDQTIVHDWHRAIAELVGTGPDFINAWTNMLDDEELEPRIKAAILWTTARNNHAPVSLAMAMHQFAHLGIPSAKIKALTIQPKSWSDQVDLAVQFAEKLTNHPTKITDADIVKLRQTFSDRQTAHLIYTICTANALDRFTVTLGLSTAGIEQNEE